LSKFTNAQKENLNQLVSSCVVQRLTGEESLVYIKDKMGIEISRDYLNHLRAQMKKSSARNLKYLQKDRLVYIQNIFFDRTQEFECMQRRLWNIINNNPDNPDLQVSCLSELRQLTVLLTNMYEVLPMLLTVHDSSIFAGQGLTNVGKLPYKSDSEDQNRKF